MWKFGPKFQRPTFQHHLFARCQPLWLDSREHEQKQECKKEIEHKTVLKCVICCMRQWASQASDCEKLKNMMLIKLAPVYVNEWGGPPTASYRWTGWVLRNNRFKSKTSGRLQIGLGNFTEYSSRNWKMSTCKRETLGSRPIMPKIFLRHWCMLSQAHSIALKVIEMKT